jgi:hypothetical protein
MATEYIEERKGGLYVAGSRISLAFIVYAFQEGGSPKPFGKTFQALALRRFMAEELA